MGASIKDNYNIVKESIKKMINNDPLLKPFVKEYFKEPLEALDKLQQNLEEMHRININLIKRCKKAEER